MWRALLQSNTETVVLPWLGGRTLPSHSRTFKLEGAEPAEHGWHRFVVTGRKARWQAAAEAPTDGLRDVVTGYLVADRLVGDGVHVSDDPTKLAAQFERVHLVEPGLDRFVRIRAGRAADGGHLVYEGQEFPLGPEDEVLQAFLDRASSVDGIAGVVPALDGAFRIESWHRSEVERRRREAEERRERHEQLRQRNERRRELRERLGDGRGRRTMAQIDFAEAAKAALAIGGAEYLDHRTGHVRSEMVVRFRLFGRRFECTCEANTLRIIDAGICLIDHATDERGDGYFTLESLPGVIQQADREKRLVVFRHIE